MEHVRSTPSLPLLLVADGIFGRPFHILVHPQMSQSLFGSWSRTKHVLRKSMPNRERVDLCLAVGGCLVMTGYITDHSCAPWTSSSRPSKRYSNQEIHRSLSTCHHFGGLPTKDKRFLTYIDVPAKLFTFIRIVFCPLGQDLGRPKIGPLELALNLIRISRNKSSLHTTAGGGT